MPATPQTNSLIRSLRDRFPRQGFDYQSMTGLSSQAAFNARLRNHGGAYFSYASIHTIADRMCRTDDERATVFNHYFTELTHGSQSENIRSKLKAFFLYAGFAVSRMPKNMEEAVNIVIKHELSTYDKPGLALRQEIIQLYSDLPTPSARLPRNGVRHEGKRAVGWEILEERLEHTLKDPDPVLRYKRYGKLLLLGSTRYHAEFAEKCGVDTLTFNEYFQDHPSKYDKLPSSNSNRIVESMLKQEFAPEYSSQIEILNQLLLDARNYIAETRAARLSTTKSATADAAENLYITLKDICRQKDISSKAVDRKLGHNNFLNTLIRRKFLIDPVEFEKVISVIFGPPTAILSSADQWKLDKLYELYSAAYEAKYSNQSPSQENLWARQIKHLSNFEDVLASHLIDSMLPGEANKFQAYLATQRTAGAQKSICQLY